MKPQSLSNTSAGFVLPNPGSEWRTEFERLFRDACRDYACSGLAMNVKDGSILVRIPAGEFEMGGAAEPDCPQHTVELSEYWIGIHCVTNRQYEKFVTETGHRMPDNASWGTPIWNNGQCPADKLDHPVVCVSWDDCVAYAKWAGLNLPTEAQWEKAARGPGGLIYPWGNEWDENKCLPPHYQVGETTAAVWQFPSDTSGYGTVQQSGNVWEWCADWWGGANYMKNPAKDPCGPDRGKDRVTRGGSSYPRFGYLFEGAHRSYVDPYYRCDKRGFRIAVSNKIQHDDLYLPPFLRSKLRPLIPTSFSDAESLDLPPFLRSK